MLLVFGRFLIPQFAFRNPKLKYLLLILIFFMLAMGLQELNLYAMPSVQRMTLSNELVLLASGEHSLPFVTIQLLVDSGSRRDPSGEEGLAYLTAKGLLHGTSKRTINQINEELDFLGASLSSSSGRDYATLTLKILKKDLEKGFDLFMEVLTQPLFPDEEIKREIEKTLAAIQSEEDQPEEVAEKAFLRALFLNSPYGHPVEGTKESVPTLKREGIIRFYRSYYHPNNAILTIVGDITEQEIKAKLVPQLEKWSKGEIPKVPFVTTFEKEQKTVKTNRPITQANIILGNAGISRDNPDFYTLTVMNYILGGGGFASRLMEVIRNKRGLAYSVASFFDPGKYPGSFQIILQTKNSSAREAISLALQQMERIQKELVLEKELESAKKYLIGSFPMRFDTQAKLANFLSQVEYYGLGLDYPEKYPSLIRSITREEILRIAKKYLDPQQYVLVIVANLKEAGLE
ncbi:MAG: M16 family metallopeptidase [Thermodesulfobacteriota bacterium]